MKWIGLTGGIGSGKSTVAKALRSRGFAVIDADEMARKVVEPGSDGLGEVVATFGQKILNPDGSLDRKELGRLVFEKVSLLEKLEKILHPHIQKLVLSERQRLQAEGRALAFYDVPLLFEKAMASMFDAVVVVDCPEPLRVERVMKRDSLGESEVRLRMSRQLPLSEKVERADYVLLNDDTPESLEPQIDDLLLKLYQPQA